MTFLPDLSSPPLNGGSGQCEVIEIDIYPIFKQTVFYFSQILYLPLIMKIKPCQGTNTYLVLQTAAINIILLRQTVIVIFYYNVSSRAVIYEVRLSLLTKLNK